jgi:hypothetical protein
MKKYFFGLLAVVVAITFSAFKAPMSSTAFKLISDPSSATTVATQSDWKTNGTLFGVCTTTPEDLACTIKLESTTMAAFYHGGGTKILNTRSDAIAAGVGGRYLEITEIFVNPRYKIATILAKQIVNVGGTLTDAPDNAPSILEQANLTTGVDVAYFNAQH